MAFFWYLMVTLLGALGTLSTLRALELLVFGGGSGSPAVQAGLGIGFLMLAAKALRKARALRSAASLRTKSPPLA